MKLLAFAASSSSKSINKKLATYTCSLLEDADTEILDLNDYEMPIYSSDREEAGGIPQLAHDFYGKIGAADALVISFAEHNGSYTAAYKNIYDWASRIDAKVFQGKPMVLLSASPGPRGAATVMATIKASAPHFGGDVKADLSIGSFYDNFDMEKSCLTDAGLDTQLRAALATLQE
ncbi:NAD(P)H-dependent oxidoreductase [Sphingorhabdus sp. Alg239-R122]|uniref:NADPH-dependent FMN reductase n=1 Tax=Sphingorhabdus sp. Alg239-R122 TaxID=2305989 RepID=UPI0013D94259|nr:NAD(P)H-dependent oxidoreductase [Sphingorhabdus sp. Alg239-R122]